MDFEARADRIDESITRRLAKLGVPFIRIALGVVFLWFALRVFARARADGSQAHSLSP